MPGGFAEEVVVADHRVHLLPEGVNLDEGAFVEPLAVAMHVLNRAGLRPEDKVAVLGAGSIGMLTIQEIAARKNQFIIASGRVDKKLSLAADFGANLVINDTKEDVVKKGFAAIPNGLDVILDFVCSQKTVSQAISLGKPGARIILIAAPHSEHELKIDYTPVYRKEMTLAASRLYSDEEFKQALSALAEERIKVAPLITARYKLNEVPQAMDYVINNRKEAIKVFIEP
jgi:threonine dehydrogenase-like Zn-dependent dehydrogenase